MTQATWRDKPVHPGSDRTMITKAKPCDVPGCRAEAAVDAKTISGPWANLCLSHYDLIGVGLGLGYGQRLVMIDQREDPPLRTLVGLDKAHAQALLDWIDARSGIDDPCPACGAVPILALTEDSKVTLEQEHDEDCWLVAVVEWVEAQP